MINKDKSIVADEVVVLTVATDDNDGLARFIRSAEKYDIKVEVLGRGEEWTGGNMNYAGGGQKVNLLRSKLKSMKTVQEPKQQIVLFTDR